jgi:hypothetical protein
MSPEQARGAHEVDHLSDQYALGLILYEAISGKRAHPGDNSLETIHNIFHRTIVRLRHLKPDCPQALEDVVMRMLSPDPEYRFHTLLDVGSTLLSLAGEKTRLALEETFRKPPGSAMHPGQVARGVRSPKRPDDLTTGPATTKSRHRRWVIVGALGAMALLAGVLWVWPRPRPGLSHTETSMTTDVKATETPPLPAARLPEPSATTATEPTRPKAAAQEPRHKSPRAKAGGVPRVGKTDENVFDRPEKAPMRPERGANDALIIE